MSNDGPNPSRATTGAHAPAHRRDGGPPTCGECGRGDVPALFRYDMKDVAPDVFSNLCGQCIGEIASSEATRKKFHERVKAWYVETYGKAN